MANLKIRAGNFLDGGQRLVIAAPGYDADPVPAYENTIFNSDWGELFPISEIRTYTASGTSAQYKSITNLGYVPMVLAMFNVTSWGSGSPYIYENNWFPLTPIQNQFMVEAFSNQLMFKLNNNNGYGPATVEFAYAVIANDAANPPNLSASRAGTNWMRWTNEGPLISKPGKDVSSASLDDFLVNPSAPINAQLLSSGSITSLPYAGTQNDPMGNSNYIWRASVSHGLGYIPIFFVQGTNLGGWAYGGGTSGVACSVDTSNLYFYYMWPTVAPNPPVSPGQPIPFNIPGFNGTLSYSILRQQWV